MSSDPADDSPDTLAAGGKVVIPAGVAMEELDRGKKKLSKQCPPELRALLEAKWLAPVYDVQVTAVCEAGGTRNVFGMWRDGEFVAILDVFRERFAEKRVRVALCRRKSAQGTKRWLEFIDLEAVTEGGGYVPQFDVANFSGQVIKTMYTKLEFPNGVAAEQIKEWGGRKKLQEKIPV